MKSKIKIFAFKWGNGDAEWVAAENKEQAINYQLKYCTTKTIIEILNELV